MPRARIAVMLTVVAALLAFTAQSASAVGFCPAEGSRAGAITEWEQTWPVGGRDHDGVTQCLGEEGIWGTDKAWLQIVDLSDGAKIRLIADREPTGPESGAYEPDVLFRKRLASSWFFWLQGLVPEEGENWAYTQPDRERLFSVTNASYAKSSDNDEDTMMPFPRWTWGVADTYGVAERLKDDSEANAFDWAAAKKYLAIGYPYEPSEEIEEPQRQTVKVGSFPTHFEFEDLLTYIQHVGGDPYNNDTIDATVAFDPSVRIGDGGRERRNFLGVYLEKVYILTTDARYTKEEAAAILQEIHPAMEIIQLDGGGSAQMYSSYGELQSNDIPFDREVPDVLAVYRAHTEPDCPDPWDPRCDEGGIEEEEEWPEEEQP